MKQSPEGGTALHSTKTSPEQETSEVLKDDVQENVPLSSFEFTNPGQKFEFILAEARKEIESDQHVIELKAGAESEELKEAEAASKKYEEGIIAAGEEFNNAGFVEKADSEYDLAPEKTEIYDLKSDKPSDKPEELTIELKQIPEESHEKAEELLEVLEHPKKENKDIFGFDAEVDDAEIRDGAVDHGTESNAHESRIRSFLKSIKEKYDAIADPGQIKKLDQKITDRERKFHGVRAAYVSLEKRKAANETKVAEFQSGIEKKSAGDKRRAQEHVIRLRNQFKKMGEKQAKLKIKMEADIEWSDSFEKKRAKIASRVEERFKERLEPIEKELSRLKNEAERIETLIQENKSRILGYEKRLTEFEGNKEMRKVYKDEFRTCKNQLKMLKLAQGAYKGRLQALRTGISTMDAKQANLIAEKSKIINAGRSTSDFHLPQIK